jgi:hypothetical protein
MVGHTSLLEQVDADFSHAHRKALLRRARTRLRGDADSDGLFCFEDLRKMPGTVGRVYRGTRTVPVEQIGGSVGRCSDFDRDFMPAKASVQERWKRIDRAFHRGEELPAVSLYKIGGFYFVLDGHHRISVARYHGVEWIDAEVTEFRAGAWSDRRDEEGQIDVSGGGEPRMQEMIDLQLAKQRREEMLRAVETNRRAKALEATHKRRAERRSALAWEMKRQAGRLLKYLRASRRAENTPRAK